MEVICMDESAVDFALLRKANYLLFKWSKRENISKTFFVKKKIHEIGSWWISDQFLIKISAQLYMVAFF